METPPLPLPCCDPDSDLTPPLLALSAESTICLHKAPATKPLLQKQMGIPLLGRVRRTTCGGSCEGAPGWIAGAVTTPGRG